MNADTNPWWVAALVGALIGSAGAGAYVMLVDGAALANCADRDSAYVELAASVEECHQSQRCLVTAQDIRDLRRARANAADACKAKEVE